MTDTAQGVALTREQRAAAASDARVTLVLAGPGAGKTTTLASRIERLLDRGADPDRILVVAFTNAAAAELEERVRSFLPEASIRTLHAQAVLLIAADPGGFGLQAPFRIAGDHVHAERVRTALRAVSDDPARIWSHPASAAELLERANERLLSPREYAASRRDLDRAHMDLLCRTAELVDRETHASGAVSLGQLLPWVARRVAGDADYARELAGRWDHVLVDEFQDLDPSQLALLSGLTSLATSLWAVGDEDQCLYGYKSVDPRHIGQFAERHPGAAVHFQTGNHRSGRVIVAAAANLISHNRRRTARPRQSAMRDDAGSVTRPVFDGMGAEAQWIACYVADQLAAGLSVGVLARSSFRCESVKEALAEVSIGIQ